MWHSDDMSFEFLQKGRGFYMLNIHLLRSISAPLKKSNQESKMCLISKNLQF